MQRKTEVRPLIMLLMFGCLLFVYNTENVQGQTAGGSMDSVSSESQSFTEDHIAYTGHGALFDKNGNQIDVSLAFIERAQNYYMDLLLAQATIEQRVQFVALKSEFYIGNELDVPSIMVANSLLLDWLIDAINPVDAAQLTSKNNLLRQQLRWMPELTDLWSNGHFDSIALASALSELDSPNEVVASASPSTDNSGQAYIDECRAAGVPIPEDWGSNQWQYRGELQNEFISAGFDAEVYTYSNSAGICIALPRGSGNTYSLLGIICQAKTSGNACFWDNTNVTKNTSVPLENFLGGTALTDTCTSCHAGENAFIIHPNTVLGEPELDDLNLMPDRWYTPIVPDDWPQNPGPTSILENVASPGDCTSCHLQNGTGGRFPELSTDLQGYCNNVLQPALGTTMPSGSNYQPHIDALLAACNREPLLAVTYVDSTATGPEQGTPANPFNTVAEGINAVANNGVLNIAAGFYGETAVTSGSLTFIIDKSITLQSTGGSVYIGKGPNTAPVATNDTFTVQAPESTVLSVLNNDNDPDGDSLSLSVATQPANGTAVASGGAIRYTPDNGFSGTDSFTYRISDGFGGSDTATVTVTVEAAPSPQLLGDATCDDRLNTADAVAVLQFAASLRSASSGCPLPNNTTLNVDAADMNNSNSVNTADAVIILQCVAQIPNDFCEVVQK